MYGMLGNFSPWLQRADSILYLSFVNGHQLINIFIYLQEEEYASVGHGISQSQDSTAHNSIAQVEDRHAKRGLSFKLRGKETIIYNEYQNNALSVILCL